MRAQMAAEIADPLGSSPLQAREACVLRIGAWRVDPALDEISRDGHRVKLERRAMQILMALAQAGGRPVSVEGLLDQVWAGLVVTPDSVYQAIASLRRVLDDDPRAPTYIASVPRRGYRLVAAVSPWVEPCAGPALAPVTGTTSSGLTAKARRPGHLVLSAILGVAALGIFGYVWRDREDRSRAVSTAAPVSASVAQSEKSIAVLPFVDLSAAHDQEYFSDGLSEEITEHLGRRRDLRVIARTSSFHFKGRNEDARTIGKQLGAAHLLEGSVRTSGDTLRVTAQLILAADGTQQWAATYDAKMGDIFKVQEAIATSVATSLGSAMAPQERQGADTKPSIAAYDAFLRGKHFMERDSKEDTQRAIAAFNEALRLEPSYAAAWAKLGDAYNQQGVWGWIRPAKVYAPARAAVDRALALNPNLALAHQVLSDLEWNYQYDFAESFREEARARELDPGLADYSGDNSAAAEAQLRGDLAQSVVDLQKSIQRDPLDSFLQLDLAVALLWADRSAEAERVVRALMELQPASAGEHAILAEILRSEGRLDDALIEAGREPDEASRLGSLADVLWTAGRHAESDTYLSQLRARFADTNALGISECYGLRNDKPSAFTWLNRAIENREPAVTSIPVDGYLRTLHGDPRWAASLHKMNLPE
jgi:TolB-like protein/DNA-binding winged helix-turn-helix (wHTH) protein/Flp pilus assembly protein TadD